MDYYRKKLHTIQRRMGRGSTSTSQLNKEGRKMFGSKWAGAWPADKIPKMGKGSVAMVNLDPSGKPGTHWLGMYQGDKLWVYDSFGRPIKNILPQVYHGHGPVKTTKAGAEQKVFEKNCGQRALGVLEIMQEFGPGRVSKFL